MTPFCSRAGHPALMTILVRSKPTSHGAVNTNSGSSTTPVIQTSVCALYICKTPTLLTTLYIILTSLYRLIALEQHNLVLPPLYCTFGSPPHASLPSLWFGSRL